MVKKNFLIIVFNTRALGGVLSIVNYGREPPTPGQMWSWQEFWYIQLQLSSQGATSYLPANHMPTGIYLSLTKSSGKA